MRHILYSINSKWVAQKHNTTYMYKYGMYNIEKVKKVIYLDHPLIFHIKIYIEINPLNLLCCSHGMLDIVVFVWLVGGGGGGAFIIEDGGGGTPEIVIFLK